ncbi:hypothetical protein M5K25_019998 [Dendrobium thyrsiflorum]|uniref:Exonuclease domain-containing protein n=1 Tax=Dendrobium thyrsiflorum TaxID=117978 RepID=A0ABD0U9E3_DENTH
MVLYVEEMENYEQVMRRDDVKAIVITGARGKSVNGPEIISQYYVENEQALNDIFDSARRADMVVVFIDGLDAIVPSRVGEGDELSDGILVIDATNQPDGIDPALRRPGRLDREIEIGVPFPVQRLDILHTLLKHMDRSLNNSVISLAFETYDFVGADLAVLCNEAIMAVLHHMARRFQDLAAATGATPARRLKEIHTQAMEHYCAGRVWAGHNILKFDCPRIREAFAEIGRPPPEPIGTIDTLPLLTQRFGRRAGDMKMATLANYFCLGPQKHRSLDDVRLNLEVLKYCSAVLFLESSVSNVPSIKNLASESIVSENCNIQNGIPAGTNLKLCSLPVPLDSLEGSSCWVRNVKEVRHDLGKSGTPLENEDAIYLMAQVEKMRIESSNLNSDDSVGGNSAPCSAANSAHSTSYIGTIKNSGSYARFLEPDEVLVNCITVSHSTPTPTVKRIQILHQNVPLWLRCVGLVIHFGINKKFTDHAGRPKLSILVNAPPSLCHVLAICDSLVQSSLRSYGSTSEWWPLMKKNAFTNSSTIRLHIPTITNCESAAMYSTEIYRLDASKNMNKLSFSKFDAAELDLLLAPGTNIDAFFCLDAYDYQQNAGIRLVAKSLLIHSR